MRETYVEELAHVVTGAGKFETHRLGRKRKLRRAVVTWDVLFSRKSQYLPSRPFNRLDEAQPPH